MFSTTFRYGLISLLELAECQDLLQARTIASRHKLSQHDLAVELADLRRLGLVQSQKGKRGGYRLQCDPREVNLLVLYHSLAGSGDASLQEPPVVGVGTGPSSGADAWLDTVSRRWSAELEGTTLADLQNWVGRNQGVQDGSPPSPAVDVDAS